MSPVTRFGFRNRDWARQNMDTGGFPFHNHPSTTVSTLKPRTEFQVEINGSEENIGFFRFRTVVVAMADKTIKIMIFLAVHCFVFVVTVKV